MNVSAETHWVLQPYNQHVLRSDGSCWATVTLSKQWLLYWAKNISCTFVKIKLFFTFLLAQMVPKEHHALWWNILISCFVFYILIAFILLIGVLFKDHIILWSHFTTLHMVYIRISGYFMNTVHLLFLQRKLLLQQKWYAYSHAL